MKKTNAVDPLYQLLEHNLFNKSYEDISAFTREVAEEYLSYLDSTGAHVPFAARTKLLEDLENEAHEMLVKRMYGCAEAKDYADRGSVFEVCDEAEPIDMPKAGKKERTAKK